MFGEISPTSTATPTIALVCAAFPYSFQSRWEARPAPFAHGQPVLLKDDEIVSFHCSFQGFDEGLDNL
jgi:hypothetical protein